MTGGNMTFFTKYWNINKFIQSSLLYMLDGHVADLTTVSRGLLQGSRKLFFNTFFTSPFIIEKASNIRTFITCNFFTKCTGVLTCSYFFFTIFTMMSLTIITVFHGSKTFFSAVTTVTMRTPSTYCSCRSTLFTAVLFKTFRTCIHPVRISSSCETSTIIIHTVTHFARNFLVRHFE